jgi:4-diphosphocytidyl-2-C-methyl-D-erythritol kinase
MITKQSPAKINLVLHVLQKREDGYHDLATLMQRISLYDEMIFTTADQGITIRCPGSTIPEDEENIVYRAARALFEEISYTGGVEIIIHKKIPVAAGLGGGSSNAATTLVTLNDLLGGGLGQETLMRMGAGIGADVPFFIFEKSAWAFGIGDRLEEARNVPTMWFVLVNPGFEVSTKKVYENLKLGLTKGGIKYTIPRLHKVPEVIEKLSNDLEIVTLELHPVLLEIKELVMRTGALGSLMSGSGPTVFGIYEDEKGAHEAGEVLQQADIGSVFTAHSI